MRCDKCGGWDKHKILCADGPGRVTDPREVARCKASGMAGELFGRPTLTGTIDRNPALYDWRRFADLFDMPVDYQSEPFRSVSRALITAATVNGQCTPIEGVTVREGDSVQVKMAGDGTVSAEVTRAPEHEAWCFLKSFPIGACGCKSMAPASGTFMHEGPDPEAASRSPTSRPIGGTVWAGSFAVSSDPRCTCPPTSRYRAGHVAECILDGQEFVSPRPVIVPVMPTNTDLPTRPTPAITTRINYANPPEAQTAQARSWRVEMGMETDATEAERLLLAMVENMGSPWRENIGSRTLCAVCHCDEIAGHRGECAWEVARKYLAARGLLKADGA